MRRAYVEASIPAEEAILIALAWAGSEVTIHVPSTRSVEDNAWIEDLEIPISTWAANSRFRGHPVGGVVIGFALSCLDVLRLDEQQGLDGLVLMYAADEHAPWVTAFDVDCIGGEDLRMTTVAADSVRSVLAGISDGVLDKRGSLLRRERFRVVQALTFLRGKGVTVDPDVFMVEMLRNGWSGSGVVDLRSIAVDIKAGKQLRYTERVRPAVIEQWFSDGSLS